MHLDTTTGKFWAQRHYGFDGNAIALRTNKSGTDPLCWPAADHHGTSSVAMDATTRAVTRGYSTPFGAPRTGGSGTWPDDKAFLGKTADAATPRSPPRTHHPWSSARSTTRAPKR